MDFEIVKTAGGNWYLIAGFACSTRSSKSEVRYLNCKGADQDGLTCPAKATIRDGENFTPILFLTHSKK